MGGTRFDAKDWTAYATTNATRSASATFKSATINRTTDPRTSFDPTTILMRESRDSVANPESTAIILSFDVTGSMGQIPYHFIQKGLGPLMQEIYARKPVTDPHILIMANGDAECDRHPLQVTQFEASMKIAEDLEKIYIEGNGGGNNGESYNLVHYFAGAKTSIDCFEKRGKKGLLFTIGDEPPLPRLTAAQIKRFIGGEPTRDLTSKECFEMASRMYECFHVIIEEGYFRSNQQAVLVPWNELLGQGRIIRLKDHTKLSEVLVSAIEAFVGKDKSTVSKSWSGDTSLVVADAIKDIVAVGGHASSSGGLVAIG
jgi:hypothetical protein